MNYLNSHQVYFGQNSAS